MVWLIAGAVGFALGWSLRGGRDTDRRADALISELLDAAS